MTLAAHPVVVRSRAILASLWAHADRSWGAAEKPRSRAGVVLLLAAQVVALVVFYRQAKQTLGPLIRTPALPTIPAPTSMTRFGMTETVRREIFRELAESEIAERQRAISQNTWNGHAWSRFDDLGYVQRARGRELALRYSVSLTQVYLVLDEGIRERWPGPDGQPLSALVEPLQLRTE
jgi:hypothetical protein